MRKPSASTYPSVKMAPGTVVAVGSCVCTTACLLPLLAPTCSVHVVLHALTIACPARLVQPQGQRCSAALREAYRWRVVVRHSTSWQRRRTWGIAPTHTPRRGGDGS